MTRGFSLGLVAFSLPFAGALPVEAEEVAVEEYVDSKGRRTGAKATGIKLTAKPSEASLDSKGRKTSGTGTTNSLPTDTSPTYRDSKGRVHSRP